MEENLSDIMNKLNTIPRNPLGFNGRYSPFLGSGTGFDDETFTRKMDATSCSCRTQDSDEKRPFDV